MVDKESLSDIRQQIVWLREERKRLEDSLLRPKKMIRASLVFLPNYCGKKDCRCRRGFPHGPPLSFRKKEGKDQNDLCKKEGPSPDRKAGQGIYQKKITELVRRLKEK